MTYSDKQKILIVDDIQDNVKVLEFMLCDDFKLSMAYSGQECLSIVSEFKPDLILLDIMMPEMDGYQVCKLLKEQEDTKDILIIFITALEVPKSRLEGFQAGANEYITKPIDEIELRSKIGIVLRNKKETDKVKSEADTAKHIAFTAMTDAARLRVIVQFMHNSYDCNELDELCSELFKALKNFGINSYIYFYELDQIKYRGSQPSKKHIHLLKSSNPKQRLYEEEDTIIFSFDRFALLAENISNKNEEERVRLKDLIATLLEGANASIRALITEQSLRQSEERHRLLIENSPYWISQLNNQGNILSINKAGYNILNLNTESIPDNLPFIEFADDHDKQSLQHSIEQALLGHTIEIDYKCQNGRFFHSSIVPYHENDKSSPQLICLTHDVTTRKETESALKHAKELAEKNSHAKSRFLANMSHEIRTPMNGITGMAQLLLKTLLTDQQKYYVETIDASGTNLLAVINDILDYSKIESGNLHLVKSPFSYRDTLEEVVQSLAQQADQRHIEIHHITNPETPDILIGDAIRLKQILLNLAGNAVKFTHEGYVIIYSRLLKNIDQYVSLEIKVCDSGIGISKEHHANIFKSFQQADISTARKYEGTGLGLAIVNELIELMEGTISVDSEIQKGTTFTIHLSLPIFKADKKEFNIIKKIDEPIPDIIIASSSQHIRQSINTHFIYNNITTTEISSLNELSSINFNNKTSSLQQILFISQYLLGETKEEITENLNQLNKQREFLVILLINLSSNIDENTAKHWGLESTLYLPIKSSQLWSVFFRAIGKKNILPDTYQNTASTTYDFNKAKILIVDDHRTNREVAQFSLEHMNCEIMTANNGVEAIKLFQKYSFDLILMDIHMPGMDGLQATKKIRELEFQYKKERTPILALTASVLDNSREKIINAGMDTLIAKPIRLEDLQNELRKRLSNKTQNTLAIIQHPSKSIPATEKITYTEHLDQSTINNLKESVGSHFSTVMKSYIEDVDSLINELKQTSDTGNLQRTAELAHAIKGSFSNIGATHIVDYCIELQNHADSGQQSYVSEQINNLINEMHIVKQEVGKLLGEVIQ